MKRVYLMIVFIGFLVFLNSDEGIGESILKELDSNKHDVSKVVRH